MTTKQQQCLLTYLGYDTVWIDGVDGPRTQEALAKFRADYGVGAEGLVGAVAGTVAKLEKPDSNTEPSQTGKGLYGSKYFTREEFRCQCKGKYCNGFPYEPTKELIFTLDRIRERLGVPITIVESGGSGVRCAKHNAEVGGVYNSEHLYGRAADLHSSASPAAMKAAAEAVMGKTGGIGLYDWGIHVDVGKYSRWNG